MRSKASGLTHHTHLPANTCPQALALPPDAAADVELQAVLLRARPFADDPACAPACFRCGAANPLLPPPGLAPRPPGGGCGGGDAADGGELLTPMVGALCVGCGAAIVVSPATWEPLPVVEFELEDGIGDAEAWALVGEGISDDLIAALAAARGGGQQQQQGGGRQQAGGGGGVDVLRLESEPRWPPGGGGSDESTAVGASAGAAALEEAWAAQAAVPGASIRLDRAALRRLRPTEVLRQRLGAHSRAARWYRAADPDGAAVAVGPRGELVEDDEADVAPAALAAAAGCGDEGADVCANEGAAVATAAATAAGAYSLMP